MKLSSDEITTLIKKLDIPPTDNIQNQGYILSIQDDEIIIYGYTNVMLYESLDFDNDTQGIVVKLEENYIIAYCFSLLPVLAIGSKVTRTGSIVKVPVGDCLIGRIVSNLGVPIDAQGPIVNNCTDIIFKKSSNIIKHIKQVETNQLDTNQLDTNQLDTNKLSTGNDNFDLLYPIYKGQYIGLLGKNVKEKNNIIMSTIIKQTQKDCICIYIAIGQSQIDTVNIQDKLKNEIHKATYFNKSNIIIINVNLADTKFNKFIALFTGLTMGEHFRDHGKNVLIIYDKLIYSHYEDFPISINNIIERLSYANKDKSAGSLTCIAISEEAISSYDNIIVIDKEPSFNINVYKNIDVTTKQKLVSGYKIIKYFNQIQYSEWGIKRQIITLLALNDIFLDDIFLDNIFIDNIDKDKLQTFMEKLWKDINDITTKQNLITDITTKQNLIIDFKPESQNNIKAYLLKFVKSNPIDFINPEIKPEVIVKPDFVTDVVVKSNVVPDVIVKPNVVTNVVTNVVSDVVTDVVVKPDVKQNLITNSPKNIIKLFFINFTVGAIFALCVWWYRK